MGSKLILVVCNGNVHRSVVAQLCITRELQRRSIDGIACVSRGLQGTAGTALPQGRNLRDYPREWSLTKPVLDRLGIEAINRWNRLRISRATRYCWNRASARKKFTGLSARMVVDQTGSGSAGYRDPSHATKYASGSRGR